MKYTLILALSVQAANVIRAQSPQAQTPQPAATLGPADVRIMERTSELLSSRSTWNQTDKQNCPAVARTYGLYCALKKAYEDVTGSFDHDGAAMNEVRAVIDFVAVKDYPARLVNYNNDSATTLADVQTLLRIARNRIVRKLATGAPGGDAKTGDTRASGVATCTLVSIQDRWSGSCGRLFDQPTAFTITAAKAITSGVWRKDAHPNTVWAGTMTDSGGPSVPIEIEIYDGGQGLVRTRDGWYPITGFAAKESSSMTFQVDGAHEVPPNSLDRDILQRADAILSSDAVWNRADDRQCPANATSWSIYCAVERAQIEVAGGFHHRRPAGQLVRDIVDERTKAKSYSHRMMDYNNDPATKLADVRSLFADALARIK